MNATILNRDFQHPADGWYQIEPLGEHPNPAAGIVQVIDAAAADSIVNAFNADARAGSLRHGNELLIDHEHFSDQIDQESRAYGWLQELQNRADGIYGRIRWTATGKTAVDGGDYRFFSTEYSPADLQVLNDSKPRRVRPTRLDGLSLTNMNNNRGQRPITNRAAPDLEGILNAAKKSPYMNPDGTFKGGFDGCILHMQNIEGHSEDSAKRICGYIAHNVKNRDEFLRPASAAPAEAQTKNQRTNMKSVATKLGLSADASEEAVLAELTKITNRATEAEGKVTSLTAGNTDLKTQNAALLGEQIDNLLQLHGVKDEKIRNRMKAILQPLKNHVDRVACLDEFGFKAGETRKEPSGGRVLNREDGRQPTTTTTGSVDDQERANRIRNRASELKGSAPTRSWDDCWKQAAGEAATTK